MERIKGNVTGCTFFNISMELWKQIKEGEHLNLIRDKDNQYDPYAIKVCKDNVQIGWVTKDICRVLSPVMDENRPVVATITKVFGNPNDRPHIELSYEY